MSTMGVRYLDGPRPRLFAHRGGAKVAPENTLAAFTAGLAAGADRLELDVHATRDGHVVVIHDPTVDRTTNGTGEVRALTLAEIRELDAGYHFPGAANEYPYRGRGVRIPTLAELLEECPEAPLNIEIKQLDPPIEEEVLRTLDRYGARERVLLAAENGRIMERIRAAAPDVLTSFSAEDVARFVEAWHGGQIDSYRPPGVALQIPPSFGDIELVTAESVEIAHRLGLEVHVWTIDDPDQMEALLDIGVDGIMTDVPLLAAAVFRRRGLR